MKVNFQLNGEEVEVEATTLDVLLDVVRTTGLTGTKEGCGVGVCGACTLLVDERPVSSCLLLAPCAAKADVWTVEGLVERDPRLLEAFVEHEGMQCGICTPGQVVAAAALALTGCSPDDEEAIRAHMSGNLCRCTGYATIIESVQAYLRAVSTDTPGVGVEGSC